MPFNRNRLRAFVEDRDVPQTTEETCREIQDYARSEGMSYNPPSRNFILRYLSARVGPYRRERITPDVLRTFRYNPQANDANLDTIDAMYEMVTTPRNTRGNAQNTANSNRNSSTDVTEFMERLRVLTSTIAINRIKTQAERNNADLRDRHFSVFMDNIDTIRFGIEVEKCVSGENIPSDIQYFHSYGNTALKTDSTCGIEFTTGTESVEKIGIIPEMLEDSFKFRRFNEINGTFPQRIAGIHTHLSIKMADISALRETILHNLQSLCLFLSPFFGWGRLRNRHIRWSNTDTTNHYAIVNIRNSNLYGHYEIRGFGSDENPSRIGDKLNLSLLFLMCAFEKNIMNEVCSAISEIAPHSFDVANSCNVRDFMRWRKNKHAVYERFKNVMASKVDRVVRDPRLSRYDTTVNALLGAKRRLISTIDQANSSNGVF